MAITDKIAGYEKTTAALIAGSVMTLVVGGFSMMGVHFPDPMAPAAQTLLTLYCVYRFPNTSA